MFFIIYNYGAFEIVVPSWDAFCGWQHFCWRVEKLQVRNELQGTLKTKEQEFTKQASALKAVQGIKELHTRRLHELEVWCGRRMGGAYLVWTAFMVLFGRKNTRNSKKRINDWKILRTGWLTDCWEMGGRCPLMSALLLFSCTADKI